MLTRDQLLRSAEKQIARGKFDQALKDYLRVLDDNPKDISTLNKVGDLYVRMNRSADSIPFFKRIAEVCSLDGFFLKAIAIYKKINKIDPARLEVYERLADLYTKQGLSQDARTQYQVLADHYQKNDQPQEAIASYKKMAAVDPNDLKIQVRLADLYRSVNQLEDAVMQYGLVGSMLLRRGAQDEAGAVFQKALELSPQDAAARNTLVRSLLAQKNPAAAQAILKAAPRTADTLALMAEAQFDLGQKLDAVRTRRAGPRAGRGATRAPAWRCAARTWRRPTTRPPWRTCRRSWMPPPRRGISRGPRVTSRRSFRSKKLTATRSRRWPKCARPRGTCPRRRACAWPSPGKTNAAATRNRRSRTTAAPRRPHPAIRKPPLGWPTFRRSRDPPAPRLSRKSRPKIFVDLEESPIEPPAAAPSVVSPAPAFVSSGSPEEKELEALIVEAEIFARYGLTDKAVERLRVVARKHPDLINARERLLELMKASSNPALAQETESFADYYRRRGEADRAEATLARFGLSAPAPSQRAAPPAESFEEFPVEPRPAPAGEFLEDFGSESLAFEPEAIAGISPPPADGPPAPRSSLQAAESESISYEGLDSLLQEEMRKAGGASSPATAPAPSLDEQNLFADEQSFFNLADELEKELAEAPGTKAPAMAGPEGEASLEEIFREFKKGVEQQLSAEDYETHSNLGIAYKEMGLIDEAIGEFQLASKDPARAVECCSMLGLCFLEKGMPQLAIKWYRKGLDSRDIKETETMGLLYDLAGVYQSTGDMDNAYRTYLDVYGLDAGFRDVAERVRELEAVKKN